jgi:hypothetical protein
MTNIKWKMENVFSQGFAFCLSIPYSRPAFHNNHSQPTTEEAYVGEDF